jgi:hypothetical protein
LSIIEPERSNMISMLTGMSLASALDVAQVSMPPVPAPPLPVGMKLSPPAPPCPVPVVADVLVVAVLVVKVEGPGGSYTEQPGASDATIEAEERASAASREGVRRKKGRDRGMSSSTRFRRSRRERHSRIEARDQAERAPQM